MSKVAIVGVEGSGKTVLMAALGEMYGKASHDSLYLMPENQAAFSFMTRIPHKMRVEHQWPEATAIESMKYLKWTVRYGTEVLTELEMLDYPGELYRMAFGDRKESEIEPHKEQIHEFLEHLVTADFLVVLLNLKDAMDIGANARNNETVWLTRGIFDYAKKLPNIKNRLLVFTQSDRYRHLLEGEGGAKALQEKHLPMLSILHPDLECAAISAVDAPESEGPSVQPTTDGGLQELMAQIVMASETGRHALDLFDKCQNAATEATVIFSSISELDQAIQQYAHALDAVGKTDAGVICAIYPGALDAHSERQKLLEEFLSELRAVRASNSASFLACDNAWSRLIEKYNDVPNSLATIRNIIKFYCEREQTEKTTRRVIVGIVACAIAIGLYFAWQSWIDKQIDNLSQDTGLTRTVCEGAFNKDSRAQHQVGQHFMDSNQGRDIVRALEWLNKSAAGGNVEAQDAICRLYYYAPKYMDEMPSDSDTAQWFKSQAESGSSWAQNVLGEIYSAGMGVAKDEQAALRWWIESAEKGNLYGMVNVGNARNRDAGTPSDYEEAIKWYRRAADVGFVEAQSALGFMYADGRGVEKNSIEAARWYRKAAEQGNADAQFWLGSLYADGRGVARNEAEAVKWYRKAAEQGDAIAQWSLGLMYDDGRGVAKDAAEATKWYQKAAKQYREAAERGDEWGQNALGDCYSGGQGVPQSYGEAITWYRKAADQGDAIAQRSLGVMFSEGIGVAKNEVEAVMWYRKAAEQGDSSAQVSLGTMYSYGQGVRKDDAEAVKWYRKAAEHGDAIAQRNLGVMFSEGIGVAKNEVEAVMWYRKAAEQGDSYAQVCLGTMYSYGQGVRKDDAEAVKWIRKAADQGDAIAQRSLGVMYDKGLGVTKDSATAAKWYQKATEIFRSAAASGDAEAQNELGDLYFNGYGIPKDEKEAAKWYLKAAGQGNVDAQYSIGMMYYNRRGVGTNRSKAVEWLRKAADQGHAEAQKVLDGEEKRKLAERDAATRIAKENAQAEEVRRQANEPVYDDMLGDLFSE